jgi:hypothetical protein
MKEREQYALVIQPTPIAGPATSLQRLRRFIKALGRGYGYKLVSIVPCSTEPETETKAKGGGNDLAR